MEGGTGPVYKLLRYSKKHNRTVILSDILHKRSTAIHITSFNIF